MIKIKNFRISIIALLWGMTHGGAVLAQEVGPGTILEVTVNELNVRPSPPRFGFSTIVTFKYVMASPVATLKSGAKVKVIKRVFVGRQQQWVSINGLGKDKSISGWIYVGKYPDLSNVKIVGKGSVSGLMDSIPSERSADGILEFFISSSYAGENVQSDNNAVEPDITALSSQVIVVRLISVFIFIVSFVVFYKTTKSTLLTIFGSGAILLIFGFISQSSLISLAQIGAK